MEAVNHAESNVSDEARRRIFADNLRKHLLNRGWSPSDLGRAASMNRENTSRYLRGLSLPTDKMLNKLAAALNVKPDDLVPGAVWSPPLPLQRNEEFRVVPGSVPGLVRLTVDKHVSPAVATRIMEILAEEPHIRAVADRG